MLVRLIILFMFSFKFSFGGFEVDFFDVGQGNCTVVRCPKGHPLLVDAGSSQGKAGEKKANTIGKIVERLISIPNESTDGTHLSFFVSHGDDDHTNWIKDILTNFKKNLRDQGERNVKIRFLLGGRPAHYSDGFRGFVEQHRQFSINQKIYISEYREEIEHKVSADVEREVRQDTPNRKDLIKDQIKTRVKALLGECISSSFKQWRC